MKETESEAIIGWIFCFFFDHAQKKAGLPAGRQVWDAIPQYNILRLGQSHI